MSELEVQEGLRFQHPDESLVRTVTFASVTSGTVVSPVVLVYDENTGPDSDVTSTVMPTNSPSVASPIVTLSALTALSEGHTYRVEVKAGDGTNTFVSIHRVRCQRT